MLRRAPCVSALLAAACSTATPTGAPVAPVAGGPFAPAAATASLANADRADGPFPRAAVDSLATADSQQAVDVDRGELGDRVLLEAHAIPAAWLMRDVDGGDDDPDTIDAAGYAVRAALGNLDQSVGLLAQGFHGDDDALDAAVLSIDMDVRMPLDRHGPGGVFAHAGAGLGVAWLDVVGEDLGTETSAQLRLGVELQATRLFVLRATVGGIVIGHPGETEAYGTFVTIGAGLVF